MNRLRFVFERVEPDGRTAEEMEKIGAVGYVEEKDYASGNLDIGYFCNTCFAYEPDVDDFGFCKKYKFHDRSFGCCNGWVRK